jgi:hypothetical protein
MLTWAKSSWDIRQALDSGPNSCFLTLAEMPGMLEEAKVALGLPLIIDNAAVFAAISQRWAGSFSLTPSYDSRLGALLKILRATEEKQLSAKEFIHILLGPFAPSESSAALTIWAKTHHHHTDSPLAMDVVVFPAKGKVLDVGAFLNVSQAGGIICLKPDGEVQHKHGKYTFVKFGSGRQESTTQAEASGTQGY